MTRGLYSDIKEYCIQLLSDYYQGKRISLTDAEDIKKLGKINRELLPESKAY